MQLLQQLTRKNKELIPLFVFVSSGVSMGVSMFFYKMGTNPNIRIDKSKRQRIIQ